MIISAKQLRDKNELLKIPKDKAGYYKWWANESEFNLLANALNVDLKEMTPFLERCEGKYCIYVGIAAKESVQKRLDWHINDKHTPNRVKNGTLSTLRQSISSIVARNQYDKEATNAFIDKLFVEYHTVDGLIKSPEVITNLHDTERSLMNAHLYLLNIQENKFPYASPIVKKLKEIRKESK